MQLPAGRIVFPSLRPLQSLVATIRFPVPGRSERAAAGAQLDLSNKILIERSHSP